MIGRAQIEVVEYIDLYCMSDEMYLRVLCLLASAYARMYSLFTNVRYSEKLNQFDLHVLGCH